MSRRGSVALSAAPNIVDLLYLAAPSLVVATYENGNCFAAGFPMSIHFCFCLQCGVCLSHLGLENKSGHTNCDLSSIDLW